MTFTGFWRRFAAYTLDTGIFMSSFMLILMLSGIIAEKAGFISVILGLILYLALLYYLGVTIPLQHGATIGKRILRLNIAMQDGSALTTKAALIRAIFQAILPIVFSFLVGLVFILLLDDATASDNMALAAVPQLLSYLWPIAAGILVIRSQKKQSISDFAAKTVILQSDERKGQPASWPARLAAMAFDVYIVLLAYILPVMVISFLLWITIDLQIFDFSNPVVIVIWGMSIIWLFVSYYLLRIHVPCKYGASPGKLLMRCDIVMLDGSPLTTGTAIHRMIWQAWVPVFFFAMVILSDVLLIESISMPLAFCVYFFWYGTTFLLVAFGKDKRSLSDRIAGTKVIYR